MNRRPWRGLRGRGHLSHTTTAPSTGPATTNGPPPSAIAAPGTSARWPETHAVNDSNAEESLMSSIAGPGSTSRATDAASPAHSAIEMSGPA